MGTITIEQIVSADGFAADPGGGLDFIESVDFGDESRTDTSQMQWLATVDAILLGRHTYEMFSSYWPTADPVVDAVAGPMSSLPKHVVTATLDHAPWGEQEAEILGGDPIAAAHAMRDRYKSTVVWGSLQLTDTLLQAGVVDELRLRIVPVLLGAGRSFTPPGLDTQSLHLSKVEQHHTGHITVTYKLDTGDDDSRGEQETSAA